MRAVLTLFLVLILGTTVTISVQASTSLECETIEGDWEGTIVAPEASLRVVFHITCNDDGTMSVTLDSLDQGAMGIPMDSGTFEDGVFSTSMAAIAGGYLGSLNETTGDFDGVWSQGGGEIELTLTRKAEDDG